MAAGPKKIGKYSKIKPVGKGSFGEVWLVADPARPEEPNVLCDAPGGVVARLEAAAGDGRDERRRVGQTERHRRGEHGAKKMERHGRK